VAAAESLRRGPPAVTAPVTPTPYDSVQRRILAPPRGPWGDKNAKNATGATGCIGGIAGVLLTRLGAKRHIARAGLSQGRGSDHIRGPGSQCHGLRGACTRSTASCALRLH